GNLVHTEVFGHRCQLSGSHQAAGCDHGHHQVHEPEVRGRGHLARFEIDWALPNLDFLAALLPPRPRQPSRWRRLEEQGCDYHDRSLNDAPFYEGCLISCSSDHVGDRRDSERSTSSKPCCGEPCSEPAMVGEPLQCAPDSCAVHNPGSEPSDGVGEVQSGERLGLSAPIPAEPRQNSPEHDKKPRPEHVNKPPFEGHQPRLKKDENSESDLDERLLNIQVFLQRTDEQCPTVLEVRHRHHAEHAEKENYPAVVEENLEP